MSFVSKGVQAFSSKYRALMVGASPLRQMARASLVVASASLAARVVGFAKELVVAACYGLSDKLDIYLMAFALVGFPLGTIVNAVQTALIAKLAGTQDTLAARISRYFTVVIYTLISLGVLLPIWLVVLHYLLPLLAAGFSPEKRVELQGAFLWLVPYYFLGALNLLAYGVLQAERRFLVNGLLPVVTPIVTIVLLAVFGRKGDWQTLVIALNTGTLIECLALHLFFYRAGWLSAPRGRATSGLTEIARPSRALLPGSVLAALGPVFAQAIAASLGSGTVAALGYGNKLPAALSAILVTAVGVTALPYFAALISQGRLSYCLHSLDKLTRWLAIAGITMAAVLVFSSDTLVGWFYQRGAFDAHAVARVVPVQQGYFLQIPAAMIVMLAARILAALDRYGAVSILAGLGVAMQSALTWWFGMQYGATGIAWAATVTSACQAVVSYLWTRSALCARGA